MVSLIERTGSMIKSQKQDLLSVIGLAVLILAAFGPCLLNGFVYWDDNHILFDNPTLCQLDWPHLARIFTTVTQTYYAPLTVLSFAIEHHFFGFAPLIYHLDNLLFHTGVSVLIYYLGLRLDLSRTAAFLAAALFAVHPMHVESVAWVTERKDVLYSFFYLLAIHQYLSYANGRRRRPYLFSLLFGFLSVLAKPMALSLPLILFLLDRHQGRPLNRTTFVDKLPFFLLLLPVAAVTYFVNARLPIADLAEAPLIWAWTFAFYLQKFLCPLVLLPLYGLPRPVTVFNPQYALAVLILLAFIGGLIYLRKYRLWTFAAAYYFLSIFFLLRFDNSLDISLVADRFMYLPSLGFCLLIGAAAARLLSRIPAGQIQLKVTVLFLVILILGMLAIKTHAQCRLWGNEETLWGQTVKSEPVPMAWENLGRVYARQHRYQKALDCYRKALETKTPIVFWTYNDMGIVATALKEYDQALAFYSQSLALNPHNPEAYMNRGSLYDQLGEYDPAFKDYSMASQYNPSFAQAYHNRAILYCRRGELQPALADLDHSIRNLANYTSAYYLRGQLYHMLGDKERARRDLETVLKLDPQHAGAKARKNLLSAEGAGTLHPVLDLASGTNDQSP